MAIGIVTITLAAITAYALDQAADVAENTGDAVEKTGNASVKITVGILVISGVYFLYKTRLI